MRRGLSRFLLVVLGVMAGVLLVRTVRGPSEPDTLVAFGTRWEPGDFRQLGFELDRPLRLSVTAIGSFEVPAEGTPDALAAYGWVIDATTRDTVWVMRPAAAALSRMTLATVEDTVALPAGRYEAYFTAFGDPLRPVQQVEGEGFLDRARAFLQNDRTAWHTDAERWRFRLDPVVPDSARFARPAARDEERPTPPDAIWTSGTVEDYADLTTYLDVPAATRVWVDATGEIFTEPIDYGWIENLETGEEVWTMTRANTVWAGGSAKNRRFRDTLRLDAGRYRIGFHTDGSHAYGDWTANPPFDPAGWGLTLGGSGVARIFDPYTDLPEIAVLRKVGDDALDVATFTLTAPTRAFVWALGELRDDERYDYGRLLRLREEGPSGPREPEVVWEMDYEGTRHGGGTERNRLAEAVLDLEPGRYALRYQTDGSHSPDDWHGSAPKHPERWGVALFALDRDFDAGRVTDLAVERGRRAGSNVTVAAPPAPPPAPNPPPVLAPTAPPQPLPLDARRLVNSQRLALPFTLDAETALQIAAVGEISGSNRYDYAWIARADDNAIVWEMTAENTIYAGGAPRNQRFDGGITLPAGTYVLHVRSDDSHAYGNFVSDPPDDPEAWGVLVEEE